MKLQIILVSIALSAATIAHAGSNPKATTAHIQNAGGQVQSGASGILTTPDPNFFFFVQPSDVNSYDQGSASFSAVASSPTTTNTVKWYKGTNSIYVPLVDNSRINGSGTTSLTISPAGFADVADYVAVANDGQTTITSAVAHLQIFSTEVDISQPGDTIIGFGDTTGSLYGANADPANVIDNTFNEWINGGSGSNAINGLGPFRGPVGIILTPSVGSTVLSGIRFYPGQDPVGSDPGSYILEGSNNGTNYSLLASGPLSLPVARNSLALGVDPTQASAQEILFSNTLAFTSYRLTFPSTVDTNAADLEIGDVEFLGVASPSTAVLSFTTYNLSGGVFQLTGVGGTPGNTFEILTNAVITTSVGSWGVATNGTFDVNGNFSVNLPVNASNTNLFYSIKTP